MNTMDLFSQQHPQEKHESAPTPPSDACYARVAIERGMDRMDGLTYLADNEVQLGQRVIVPVGRGNTPTGGYVIELGNADLLDGYDPNKVKAIASTTPAVLPESLIELAKWMSIYYMCPLGMVLGSVVPAAVKADTGRRRKSMLNLGEPPNDEQLKALSPGARRAWAKIRDLDPTTFPIEPRLLAARIEEKSVAAINRLTNASILAEVEVEVIRAPKLFDVLEADDSGNHTLTETQTRVVEGICAQLGNFSPNLLHGVTGSGKTEVYINIVKRVLARGERALMLVPEIALTPQTAGRFVHTFREAGVAVLHSGLTKATRNQQWAMAASGEARVVIGARSAVFAPLEQLGVIIIDEEHDSSYKQDQLPRYNARDAAVKRSQIESCPVVLGSATPSLESWHNAKAGRYTLWSMPERVGNSKLPAVKVVNLALDEERMKAPKAFGPNQDFSIGRSLGKALYQTIEEGRQAILLLNRRGFASVVVSSDRASGWKLECDQCDTTMVVHKGSVRQTGGRRFVRCHHCLSEQLIPKACPISGKPLVELGVGTQRVEDEIAFRYGESLGLVAGESYERVDADTMNKASDYFSVLDRFRRGELKLLLGTQMIAKGLDFPNVSLVGVLSADTAMHLPDFRAEERTYQLVSQVAGRAGRGTHPGQVIVQTLNPHAPSISRAARHDYVGFAGDELGARYQTGLPPFVRMVRIVVRDENHEEARARTQEIASLLREYGDERVQVNGPMPCTITRIANFYRFAIEMLCPSPKPMQDAMQAIRAKGMLKSDSQVAIDVDPLWLM
ncbi:MAG: primosomal protein N' [Phycisphaerae bacterium]|nr:primosomal protein N' [Phycisphaerae bacterium]MBM90331.1 primosomal protein N' [Phycisphaerae bacterium]